ncbi:MAG: MBOAT family protein [Rhodocyclaceae bacterium]|nr:MBOAT family protein [Rhodocyclaceae bacterium]
MLFNSFEFLLIFLPLTLLAYFTLARISMQAATGSLAAASLFFYGWWDIRFVPLLLASIIFNFWAGILICRAEKPGARLWLIGAIVINLGLLAYFKYADFFVDSLNTFAVRAYPLPHVTLPIGISFFTFTQIAYLVDAYKGLVREFRPLRYALFVTYFPHLIAGPVLHHAEMMPQFGEPKNFRFDWGNFAVGMSIFTFGLAKKLLIADNLAPLAVPVFSPGAHPELIEAWIGTLAYTCQLYFDFSGYSDMAIGLSRLFGVRLPLNFNSPYQAANITEFWRRWHMTLSRFLRDYLYIPLGGNRDGRMHRYRNLMLTMLLGGLWHGAGWTFVIWGGLHGLYLVIHHAWQFLGRKLAPCAAFPGHLGSRILTFLAIVFAWTFFRAPDLASALDVASALLGANGISFPHGLAPHLHWLEAVGLHAGAKGIRWFDSGEVGIYLLPFALLIAWFAPNTQEIFRDFDPCLEKPNGRWRTPGLTWLPALGWSVVTAFLLIVCVINMNRVSEFLYFQF